MVLSEQTAIVFPELLSKHRIGFQTFHQRVRWLYGHKSYDSSYYTAKGGMRSPPVGCTKEGYTIGGIDCRAISCQVQCCLNQCFLDHYSSQTVGDEDDGSPRALLSLEGQIVQQVVCMLPDIASSRV